MSLLTMGPHIQLYVDPTTCVFEISKIFRYEWNGNSLYFKLITHIVYYILTVKVKHIVTCKVKKIVYNNFIINTAKKFQMTIRFCVVCVSVLCRFCTLWFSFRGTITVLSTVTKKHMSVVLCAFDGVLIKKVLKWVNTYLCMCCGKWMNFHWKTQFNDSRYSDQIITNFKTTSNILRWHLHKI